MKCPSYSGYNPILTSYMVWASGALHFNWNSLDMNGGGTITSQSISLPITTPLVLVITINHINGCAINYSLNGTINTMNTNPASTVNINTNFMLGCWKTDGRRFYGGISEFMYYNKVLSNTEIQQVEGYLAWKWGLQTNLPTLHPYRNSSAGSGYLF